MRAGGPWAGGGHRRGVEASGRRELYPCPRAECQRVCGGVEGKEGRMGGGVCSQRGAEPAGEIRGLAATSQGVHGGKDSVLEPPEGFPPGRHLNFSSGLHTVGG